MAYAAGGRRCAGRFGPMLIARMDRVCGGVFLALAGGGMTMLRHVVFFSARNREDVERLYEGLLWLTQIPHGRVEIGHNLALDPLSVPVDLVVCGEFADEAELAHYKAHPT